MSVQASVVVTFTELLQKAPGLPFDSVMNTSIYMCGFMERCWEILQKFSPTNLQHDLKYNKASQLEIVSSHAGGHKLQPDTILVAENCTLMLGEDKHIDLAAAYADLSRKRVDLSGMHYGPVKFLLGYAAAGTTVQWCFLPDHTDQVAILLVSACCLRHQQPCLGCAVPFSLLFSASSSQQSCCLCSAACPSDG